MNISQEKQQFVQNAKKILNKKGYKTDDNQKVFHGSFGFVFFVVDNQDGSELAAKAISLNNYSDKKLNDIKLVASANQEAFMLRDHIHRNIVTYIDHFIEENTFVIIMERASMTLEEYVKQNKNISQEEFFEIAGQLVDAILYLHKSGIVLRDFKPQNVLVFSNKVLKLSDFGLSKKFHSQVQLEQYKQSQIKGSFMYYPPEIMEILNNNDAAEEFFTNNSIKQTTNGDIWALGISLFSFLGAKPYDSIAISCGYIEFEGIKGASSAINKFLTQILIKDENLRPNIEQIQKNLSEISVRYKSNIIIKDAVILRDKYENLKEAERLLESAIQIDPQNSWIYSNLALTLFRQNEETLNYKILSNIQKATKLDNNNDQAICLQMILAKDDVTKNKLKEAAFKINKTSQYTLHQIGYDFWKSENYKEALHYFNLNIKFNKNYGRSYYMLGSTYWQLGDFSKSIQMYLLGGGRDMSDSRIFTEVGRLHVEILNQIEIGEHYLKYAVRLNPGITDSQENLYEYFKKYKKDNEAYQILEFLIQSCPKNHQYRLDMIEILCNLNRYQEAEEQAQISIDQFQTSLDFWWLGIISTKLKKKDEMIEAFNKSVQLDQKNPSLYETFAKSCEEFGENKKAFELYSQQFKLSGIGESDMKRLKEILQIK